MSKEAYEKIYEGMNGDTYNAVIWNLNTGKTETVISAELVEKACKDEGIDFNGFMKYARERKARENKVIGNE